MERSYSIPNRARAALVVLAFAISALSASATAAGLDRYVNATGGVDSGTCTVSGSPCLSIAYAITQSAVDDTISIAPGTYVAPLTITTEGLKLVGQNPANKPVITRISGSANQPLLVIIGVKNVEVRDLEFRMDQTFVAEGIIASGFVDGLSIVDNVFNYIRSGANTSTYGYRNAISINDTQNSQGLGRTNGSLVTVDGNTINGVDLVNGVLMRIGIDIDGSIAHVTNNVVASGVHDIRVRFPTKVGALPVTDTLIDGNTLNGRGLELAVPNASAGPITISNNHLHAIGGINDSTFYDADYSIMRLIGNSQSISLAVTGNTFSGYQGYYRGVLVQNFPGANFVGNTFTPAPDASDFVSLVISNKELNTGTAAAPLEMSLTATGNTFNGSGVVGAGRAVEFLDDNHAGGAASFGSLLFGGAGPGEANIFDVDLRWYFRLDNHNCNTVSAPTCTFLNYNGAIGNDIATNTQVRPFTGNVSASQNLFDGALPSAMSANQKSSLLGHTFDKMADTNLGMVNYGISATKPVVYVDGTYAGHSYGDPLVFNHGAVTPGTVYFGINAFATIPVGVMNVDVGGPVYVAKGNYADSLTLTKHLQVIGDGNSGVDTVISNLVTINASGASHAAPLLFQNLRVSNASGDGVRVNSASFLAFDDVELSGNSGSGLNFFSVSDDIVVVDSTFDGNAGHGIRTASTAQISNVDINGSTFSNNSTGILLFGSGSSGDGQISSWTITNSQFLSNENTNLNVFGGGIWIKTAGPGSVINGVSVSGSTFADNGSANTLNRVGITVRARSGTTMQNVSICNNTFVENPGTLGTQLTGINVVDETANTGYQPITVCASNAFAGLGHSVSGLEQFNLYGTQPVVAIPGGSIANTEYINGLVERVGDGALFPTIGAAMNDAATTTGDELHAPAGIYAETVTFTHNDMTLRGDGAATIIDGGNGNQPGITLPSGRTGSTITDLTVQNVHNSCIHGNGGNNDTVVSNTLLTGCRADIGSINGAGVYMNGPVDSVIFDNNEVTASAPRGLVIWNGYKTNITITNNNVHDMVGCCGIELQDGTASGVTVTGNTITNTGDSGMAFVGLRGGVGANLIDGNTITNTGRFGIEIKLPNGNGALSGIGSIVVSNNIVTRPAMPTSTDQRDVSGIAVIRRAYNASTGAADITSGVIVTGNTVSGWMPASGSPNDGFGIVMEGTGSSVYANTLSGNDVALQLQAGNDGFPGDSNQDATNDFFSRGNAPVTCVAVGSNTFSGNDVDDRSVSNPAGQHLAKTVQNVTRGTSFCSIQAAIDDAATVNGDVITVAAGTYAETIRITKQLSLQGPFVGTPGYDGSRSGAGEAVISPPSGRALRINADNVSFDGFTIENVNEVAISSGGNFGGGSSHVVVSNNRVIDVHTNSAIYTNGDITTGRVYDWTVSDNLIRNIDSASGSGINLWKATGGTISGNQIENSGHGGIQLNNSMGINVFDNRISNTAGNGINVALSENIAVIGNLISDANTDNDAESAGLTLYGGSSNIVMMCNAVDGAGNNGFSTKSSIVNPISGIRVFDNALTVVSSVSHNLAQSITIGSNWYGGGNATLAGINVAGASVADPLAVTPIGSAICNAPNPATANAPTAIVAYAGTPQNAQVNTPFAASLDARVVDALGGAVMGESVSFAAPGSGASAGLGTASGVTDYNGVLSTSATANNLAGSYAVTASSGSLSPDASFALTNDPIISTVTWDDLSFVYDSNTHVATAHITDEPGTMCTVTPVFGPNVGNYAVTATCSGTTYAASGTNSASITPASATLALSNLTQTFDGSPKPATVTSTPSGVGYSVTYNGNPIAPSAIGTYAVVATITDPNYSGPQASDVLHIVEADAPDLGISITDGVSFVQYNKLLTYTIVVNNPGNTAISGATVSSVLPITLLNASPSWQCVQVSPGASCTPSGTGNLSDTAVTIPAGGGVVYLFNAWVNDDPNLPTDLISTTATVSAAGDTNSGNDSATDETQAVIFRDGFEVGGNGAEDASATSDPDQAMSLIGDDLQLLDLATVSASDGRIVELARVIGSEGETIRIQALRTSERLLVRLLGDNEVSAWAEVASDTAQLAVAMADHTLLLVGATLDLQLGIGSTTVQVWIPLPTQE